MRKKKPLGVRLGSSSHAKDATELLKQVSLREIKVSAATSDQFIQNGSISYRDWRADLVSKHWSRFPTQRRLNERFTLERWNRFDQAKCGQRDTTKREHPLLNEEPKERKGVPPLKPRPPKSLNERSSVPRGEKRIGREWQRWRERETKQVWEELRVWAKTKRLSKLPSQF